MQVVFEVYLCLRRQERLDETVSAVGGFVG